MKVKNPEAIEQKKQDIINLARQIILEEGLENISIRKIANKLQQTPGIIYHYFKDKDEIFLAIVEAGYQGIIKVLMDNQYDDIEKTLYCTFKGYIEYMLENHYMFTITMNSNNKQIKERVNILEEGLSNRRGSMQLLCKVLEQGNKEKLFSITNIELRAQTMWCATYGLIQRLVKEQPKHQERIIEEHVQMLLQSLRG